MDTLLLLLLSLGLTQARRSPECDENAETNSNQLLCIPADYAKEIAPLSYGRTHVGLSLRVMEVAGVEGNVVTLSCQISAQWKDERIRRRRGFGRDQAAPGVDYRNNPQVLVQQDLALLDDLWRPDLYIYNLKSMTDPDDVSGAYGGGLWIGTDGTVQHTFASTIAFRCPMDFSRFPMDVQLCKLRIGSISKTNRQMLFSNADPDLEWTGSAPSGFRIEISALAEEDQTLQAGKLGNFSVSGIQVSLSRNVAGYFTSYYIPSVFLVVMSWVSLTIPSHQTGARTSLLALVFLILVVLMDGATDKIPQTDGISALEVWLFACICFTFGTFFEYGILLLRRQRSYSRTITVENVKYEAAAGNGVAGNEDPLDCEDYGKIDRYYLILFPSLFVIFNIAYWLAYFV